MKKNYNIKYRKHNDILIEINQMDKSLEKLQNNISKLIYKKKTIISYIDSDFYYQFDIMLNRINKDIVSFIFEFFGYSNTKFDSIKVSTLK